MVSVSTSSAAAMTHRLLTANRSSSPCSTSSENETMRTKTSDNLCKPNGCKARRRQLQLPSFLSKSFHMINACDDDIACWSEDGENFVIKDIDTFASAVLPNYFRHSNFSSFTRQLNFYGFSKLRSEALITSDIDPNTEHYVRFYHENFKRGHPDLLHHIRRATRADPDAKDDPSQLRQEVDKLRKELENTQCDYNRKLADLSYECNRRIASMNAEYDKLVLFVHQALGVAPAAVTSSGSPPTRPSLVSEAPPPSVISEWLRTLNHAAGVNVGPSWRTPTFNTSDFVNMNKRLREEAASKARGDAGNESKRLRTLNEPGSDASSSTSK